MLKITQVIWKIDSRSLRRNQFIKGIKSKNKREVDLSLKVYVGSRI